MIFCGILECFREAVYYQWELNASCNPANLITIYYLGIQDPVQACFKTSQQSNVKTGLHLSVALHVVMFWTGVGGPLFVKSIVWSVHVVIQQCYNTVGTCLCKFWVVRFVKNRELLFVLFCNFIYFIDNYSIKSTVMQIKIALWQENRESSSFSDTNLIVLGSEGWYLGWGAEVYLSGSDEWKPILIIRICLITDH